MRRSLVPEPIALAAQKKSGRRLGRIIVEMWRGDLDRGAWLGMAWLTTGRLTALGFIALGVIIWAFSWKRPPFVSPQKTPKEA